jgi:hypothetical protein
MQDEPERVQVGESSKILIQFPGMNNTLRLAVVAAFSLFPVCAATVTFTYTGNGTGTFNGTAFTNDPFVIAFDGETTDENPNGNGFTLTVTGTIALSGFGSATLTNPQTESYELPFMTQNGNLFVNGEASPPLGFISIGADFNTWNGGTPLGPEAFFLFGGPGTVVAWQTNSGEVGFTNVSSNTFGASEGVLTITTSPEPSSSALVALALFSIPVLRRAAKTTNRRASAGRREASAR